ncbi:MAG: hypothetical protein JJU05_09880 [Verrucomicrobia bacterium]|nr:hypothetical protein [Verrucomicrobiota bacterium]MCH8527542.1 hypothetical protein [Kiritimatiellia bacterium]
MDAKPVFFRMGATSPGLILAALLTGGALSAEERLAAFDFGPSAVYANQHRFERDFNVQTIAGNHWRVGTHLQAPGGQDTGASHKTGIPGFQNHEIITITLDSQLGINWRTGPDYHVAFSASLRPEPDAEGRQDPGLYFQIAYLVESFGEESEYTIRAPRNTPYIWHPASLFVDQDGNGPGTRRWLRWQAVWTADPVKKTLQLTLTVFDLGPEGGDAPRRVTAFVFDPIQDKALLQSEKLYFELRGRARGHFGISAVNRIRIEGNTP